jgi:Family of unknown function (DUF6058)
MAYIRANYLSLDELCADRPESAVALEALIDARRLPRPSYLLDDGTAMFPADYFRLVDGAGGVDALPEPFAARHREAARAERAAADEVERDWEAYLDGTYGVCLREVTPETILRKTALLSSLAELLMLPCPRNADWRRALCDQVNGSTPSSAGSVPTTTAPKSISVFRRATC